jgi:hypothetical protein
MDWVGRRVYNYATVAHEGNTVGSTLAAPHLAYMEGSNSPLDEDSRRRFVNFLQTGCIQSIGLYSF